MKKKNKSRIQQKGSGQMLQNTKRSQLGAIQMTVREYNKQNQEHWKHNKLKSRTFKLSSTLCNLQIGKHVRNAHFKQNHSPTSSSSKQSHFQNRSNSYSQHPNSSDSWKHWCETETADYFFGCGEPGHWKWTCPKRKQSYHRRSNKK